MSRKIWSRPLDSRKLESGHAAWSNLACDLGNADFICYGLVKLHREKSEQRAYGDKADFLGRARARRLQRPTAPPPPTARRRVSVTAATEYGGAEAMARPAQQKWGLRGGPRRRHSRSRKQTGDLKPKR